MSGNRTPQTVAPQGDLDGPLDYIRAYIEYQKTTGVAWLPRSIGSEPTRSVATAVDEPATPVAATPLIKAAASPDLFISPAVRSAGTLEALRAEIGDCQRCKLCRGRTNIVFGVGNPKAELMFVGEGPGRDEDLQAEPFVGRAGKLLTEIITKGMKLKREDVYIANVVKCRPPENRNPEPDEIAACRPFLERQIQLVAPKVLVALGTFAAQTMLGVRTPISRLRGQWFEYDSIKLMPTLHPAYLLRNPNDKRLVWNDVKLVMQELGLPV
jgi:DNA polymerase